MLALIFGVSPIVDGIAVAVLFGILFAVFMGR